MINFMVIGGPEDFRRWERSVKEGFQNTPLILSQTRYLCQSLDQKTYAEKVMKAYGKAILRVDLTNPASLPAWRTLKLPEIEAYHLSDKEIEELLEEERKDDKELARKGGRLGKDQKEEKVGVLVPHGAAFSEEDHRLCLSMFDGALERMRGFVSQVANIVESRISKKEEASSVWVPLTTRSVEGMFSEWRRKAGDNSEIRATTMQMRLFLKLFTYSELIDILKKYPTNQAISKFLPVLERPRYLQTSEGPSSFARSLGKDSKQPPKSH